jgi:hypothetical protein
MAIAETLTSDGPGYAGSSCPGDEFCSPNQAGAEDQMKRSRFVTRLLLSAVVLGGVAYSSGASADPIYPTPQEGVTSLTFGDFTVYSLPYLNNLTNSNNFNVQSSPGQIQNGVVALAGSNGNNLVQNTGNINNAYQEGTSGQGNFFNTTTAQDPGTGSVPTLAPAFNGDTKTTWDARISDLRSALSAQPGQNQVFIYYDFNQKNSIPGVLATTDVNELVWASVTLGCDPGHSCAPKTFFLAGNPFDGGVGLTNSQNSGAPTAGDFTNNGSGVNVNDPKWSQIHGAICVDSTTGLFIDFGKCQDSQKPAAANGKTVDQVSGTSIAKFALVNNELSQDILFGNQYDFLQVDLEVENTDSGRDQIFLEAGTEGGSVQIPEPRSLALFGAALTGLGLVVRARRRKA